MENRGGGGEENNKLLSVSVIFEDVVTRRQVGEGLGGMIGIPAGGLVGSALGHGIGSALGLPGEIGASIGGGLGLVGGSILGRKIGRENISNPDDPADFNKASHRIGHLARAASHPAVPAANIVASTLASATLGRPRILGAGTLAAGMYNYASPEGAAKIGYKTPGRLGALFFGPLAGLVRPDQVNPNRR